MNTFLEERRVPMHKTSAWPLALVYAALIFFASLFPFNGWRAGS